jgi:hypothetical protein
MCQGKAVSIKRTVIIKIKRTNPFYKNLQIKI